MAVHVVLTVLLCLHPHDVAAAELKSRLVALSQRVPGDIIVGRAVCGGTAWLLNDAHQLIALSLVARTIVIRGLQGLRKEDSPWGLACLADQALWTLVAPRTIAQLAHDGRVVERVSLPTPALALFGAGPRVLLESLPLVVASTVFTVLPPRQPWASRPWPGFNVRGGTDRADVLKRNIVNCGLADGPSVPCWFSGDTAVSMSDGVRVDHRVFPLLRGPGVDEGAPLRDVAVSRDRFWLLTASSQPSDGRRVASSLVLATARGQEIARLDARPSLRVILTATDANCLVLNAAGEALEVALP